MRTPCLAFVCVAVVGVCAYLAGKPDDGPASVAVRLVDADTGDALPGLVRVTPKGKADPLPLPGLYDRLRGLKASKAAAGWHVVPAKGGRTALPRQPLRVEAVSGLESASASVAVDLADDSVKEIVLKLPAVFRPEKEGLAAANTHLHLRSLTKEDAEEYLRQIPAADRLAVTFISYLERKDDDKSYVTNHYPVGEVKALRGGAVLFDNGEEHRHNFEPYGQGYGHVLFLGLSKLVRPVSLGKGITGGGDDDRPLKLGIDEARKQGAAVIWCHNASGYEDVPSALAGRFDAINVFDGTRVGAYEERYYRFLEVGLRLPISTGTDWFVYDFSRVYARPEGALTIASWLAALKAGRNVATNGPLLRLKVGGKAVGEVLALDGAGEVVVEAEGVGRHDFERLQLVHDGKVVQEAKAEKKGAGNAARLTRRAKIDGPGWFAARVETKARNELDNQLFAHTSPVYVDVEGRRRFDPDAAEALSKRLEESRAAVAAKGTFTSGRAKAELLAVYAAAADDLRARARRRGKE